MQGDHWFAALASVPVAIKLAAVAAANLALAVGGWVTYLVAQETEVSAGTLLPAGALTATSGALVYVVRLIASGTLVHRDPAVASSRMIEVVERSNELQQRGLEREQLLTDLLLARQGDAT